MELPSQAAAAIATIDLDVSVIWNFITTAVITWMGIQMNRKADKEDKWREVINDRMRNLELDMIEIKTWIKIREVDDNNR